jgi:hypothetical protein
MAEYSRDAMRAAGLTEVAVHELPAIVSFPEHAEFRVLAPNEIAIQANTLGHSLETMPEGITGELIYVGSGAEADFEGKDVRGKIILTELSYSPARHEKQRIAGLRGAIGAVMMNWGLPENEAVPFGSVKPVWGNPTPQNFKDEMPTIPCIGIARVAGLKLKDLCAKGSVRVWFRTHVVNGWRPVQITIAELPALDSPEPGDFIMVGGHQDSWPGEAATDNAAGSAIKIELGARLQAAPEEAAPRAPVRLLDRARDRHHGGLGVVRRSLLGQAARPRLRLPADRPALLRRHHHLAHHLRTPS